MDKLKTNFGKRKVYKNSKTSLVQNIFSEVSTKYDLMNDIMSFGTHRLWKKKLIDIMNIQKNEKIIDVGAGTGDLTKLIINKNINNIVYCTDLNSKMLELSKKRFTKKEKIKIKFINANAENLPFEKNYFDKYVISFCLRNITDINKSLREALRILKPGGAFYCLEFSTPNSSLINQLYSKYKKIFIPYMGKKFANNKLAYKYLEESISLFPHQDILLNNIKENGFENVSYINLFDGIISIHKGYKIHDSIKTF